jgi:hypothetical protein
MTTYTAYFRSDAEFATHDFDLTRTGAEEGTPLLQDAC